MAVIHGLTELQIFQVDKFTLVDGDVYIASDRVDTALEVKLGDVYDIDWVVEYTSPTTVLFDELLVVVDAYLFFIVSTYKYQSLDSVTKYPSYPNPYQLNSTYLSSWIADVYFYMETESDKIIAGTRVILPTTGNIVSEIQANVPLGNNVPPVGVAQILIDGGSTVPLDVSFSKFFRITLDQNSIVDSMLNKSEGKIGQIVIKQNNIGGFSISFLQANGYFSVVPIIIGLNPFDVTVLEYLITEDLSVQLTPFSTYNLGV